MNGLLIPLITNLLVPQQGGNFIANMFGRLRNVSADNPRTTYWGTIGVALLGLFGVEPAALHGIMDQVIALAEMVKGLAPVE